MVHIYIYRHFHGPPRGFSCGKIPQDLYMNGASLPAQKPLITFHFHHGLLPQAPCLLGTFVNFAWNIKAQYININTEVGETRKFDLHTSHYHPVITPGDESQRASVQPSSVMHWKMVIRDVPAIHSANVEANCAPSKLCKTWDKRQTTKTQANSWTQICNGFCWKKIISFCDL